MLLIANHCPPSFSQTEIVGNICDKYKAGLSDISVTLMLAADSSIVDYGFTDAKGYYNLSYKGDSANLLIMIYAFDIKRQTKSIENKSQDKVSVKNPLDFFKNAMDAMLERRCKAEGKRHVKLEDFFAANDALDKADVLADSSFNLHEQADILYQCMLYEAKSKDKLHVDKLENAYQDKNFAKFSDGYMHQHDYINSLNLTTTLKEKLFQYEKKRIEIIGENRTLNWMDKILAEINAAPTLVAVGINHFIGEKGLIHLLRQYGYTIEPVK